MLIIQSNEVAEARVVDQFRRRRLASAQYHGGEATAVAWSQWSRRHQLSRPPAAPIRGLMDGDLCVVDLGPGSGQPLLHVTDGFQERVRRAVGVDVSEAMLRLARDQVRDRGLPP